MHLMGHCVISGPVLLVLGITFAVVHNLVMKYFDSHFCFISLDPADLYVLCNIYIYIVRY